MFGELVQKWLGSLIRAGLVALGMWLMNHQWIDSELANALVGLAPILASVIWSLYQKWHGQQSKEIAKELPSGATNAEIARIATDSTWGEASTRAFRS